VEVQEVEADRKMQEVEVGTGRLVGRGGSSTGLARARARVRSWGNGEQQQDDGRVGKGLASMGVLVCSRR